MRKKLTGFLRGDMPKSYDFMALYKSVYYYYYYYYFNFLAHQHKAAGLSIMPDLYIFQKRGSFISILHNPEIAYR